jgi:hypothetical protein
VPLGPGKYDSLCEATLLTTVAEAVVLIVINGFKGSGFSVTATPEFSAKLPDLLRRVAKEIESSFASS